MRGFKKLIQKLHMQEDFGTAVSWLTIYAALGFWYLTLCRAFWPF